MLYPPSAQTLKKGAGPGHASGACSCFGEMSAPPHHDPFHPRRPHPGLSNADAAEVAALARILHALSLYGPPALAEVARWERAATALPPAHAAVLAHSLPTKAAAGRAAVAANAAFLADLVAAVVSGAAGLGPGMASHLATAAAIAGEAAAAGVAPAPADVEKVRYLLRNAARDWSAAGAGERAACYGRLVGALVQELRPPPPAGPAGEEEEEEEEAGQTQPHPPPPARPRVLVPGAGLARLALDLAAAGFAVEANEHSFYMLLGSAYLLNAGPTAASPAPLHPWALSPCNRAADADQFRAVSIPDADPGALAAGAGPGGLSMVAGEFTAVYGRGQRAPGGEQAGADAPPLFDAVATAFFLDCAPNPLAFIDAIAASLRPGGLWVNCGPVLWHWAGEEGGGGCGGGAEQEEEGAGGDSDDPAAPSAQPWPHSLELSLADVLTSAAAAGFDLVRPVEMVPGVPFNEDAACMVTTTYTAAFWVMRKRGTGR